MTWRLREEEKGGGVGGGEKGGKGGGAGGGGGGGGGESIRIESNWIVAPRVLAEKNSTAFFCLSPSCWYACYSTYVRRAFVAI